MSARKLSLAVTLLALWSGTAHAQNQLANGGFETAPGAVPNPPGGFGYFADSWLFGAPANIPVVRSSDRARSGTSSALLSVPNGLGGSTMFQNSVDHGGLPAIGVTAIGQRASLSFWASGEVSRTGNAVFSLRYLDGVGNILANSGSVFFQNALLNNSTWYNITYTGPVIPVGTVAMFLEITTASGPLLNGPSNKIYIDDVDVRIPNANVVPEPSTYAMIMTGLAGLGVVARRRRVVQS